MGIGSILATVAKGTGKAAVKTGKFAGKTALGLGSLAAIGSLLSEDEKKQETQMPSDS